MLVVVTDVTVLGKVIIEILLILINNRRSSVCSKTSSSNRNEGRNHSSNRSRRRCRGRVTAVIEEVVLMEATAVTAVVRVAEVVVSVVTG